MDHTADQTVTHRPAPPSDPYDWEAAVCPPPGYVNLHLGRRFNADGIFLPEHGNTVVCQVIPGSPTEAALTDIRLVLQSLPFAHHFAFTEISSYHMTVFEGVIESRRLPEHWPKDVPTDLEIDAVTQIMQARLQGFVSPPTFRMAPVQVAPFGLRLAGATAADERAVRDWRDALAEVTGLRTPKHDTYGFHTTLAYLKTPLPAEALATYRPVMQRLTTDVQERIAAMDLARPAFCRFADMNRFPPVTRL